MNFSKLLSFESDRNSLYSFLIEKHLILQKLNCKCGSPMKLVINTDSSLPFRWKCTYWKCGTTASMLSKSIFQYSKIDIIKVLSIIYFWSNDYTVGQCVKESSTSLPTVSKYYQIFRGICENYMLRKSKDQIGGKGIVVEIDESCFSKRKFNVGRITKNVWVFGGIERETKNYFFEIVPNRTSKTLIEIIKKRINPESIIISDCWASYSRLELEGFMHLSVNHKLNFVDPETGAHTQNIESFWALVKKKQLI